MSLAYSRSDTCRKASAGQQFVGFILMFFLTWAGGSLFSSLYARTPFYPSFGLGTLARIPTIIFVHLKMSNKIQPATRPTPLSLLLAAQRDPLCHQREHGQDVRETSPSGMIL